MTMRGLAVATLLLVVAVAGCLGGPERSDWAYDATQLSTLASAGKTGRGIVVGVLDTGIDPGHPSLGHLRNGKTDDGELIAYRDFLTGAQGVDEAEDPDGHGTHVVGIMSARPSGFTDRLLSGGVKLRGGSPDVQLVVARVCNASSCDGQVIPQAIRWATDQGADVLSLSLGGNSDIPGFLNDALQDDLEAAIQRAVNRGVVVIASAGNSGDEADDVAAPANIPVVIAVGAVDKDLAAADFSQGGDPAANNCRRELLQLVGRCPPNQKPELVAPGVDILSTYARDTYATASGTSQATPFVTSAVALILQDRPPLSGAADVKALKQALVDSARKLPDQDRPHDNHAGYGLVQAQAAAKRLGG